MDAQLDRAPCGYLRTADDGRILETNTTLRTLLGHPPGAEVGPGLAALLGPAARAFCEISLFPNLRLAGRADEVYLTLRDRDGRDVPVLVNARRDAATGEAEWVLVRMEQRARWEEEVVRAQRLAERESAERARQAAELAAAKAELERTLAELNETNWLLRKAAEVLPTCMYCQRVKGDRAQWESAIEYLKRNALFLSHGCCPECLDRMRADFNLPDDRK